MFQLIYLCFLFYLLQFYIFHHLLIQCHDHILIILNLHYRVLIRVYILHVKLIIYMDLLLLLLLGHLLILLYNFHFFLKLMVLYLIILMLHLFRRLILGLRLPHIHLFHLFVQRYIILL